MILFQNYSNPETPTSATICFSITDTGIGIPEQAQEKLFKPFSQVDASTTRSYGGTGLGLSLCKRLVTLMNGEIGVESQPGQGSKFWFTVPLAKQPRPEVPPEQQNSLHGKRVLVVDDNATNRKVIHYQATKWGMEVDEANGAETALQALRDALAQGVSYDLALIDMKMPEINGLTLGQQIKDRPELSSIPLIMLTSTTLRGQAQRALESGFAAYLVKPIRPSRLLDTVLTTLAAQSDASPPQEKPLASQTTTDSNDLNSLRILVAEDNVVNQKVVLKQLEKLGYRADFVANGQEVLQILQQVPYDMIFMDCQMPVLDGYETTREIRRGPSGKIINCPDGDRHSNTSTAEITADIPKENQRSHAYPVVIALTANAMEEDREKCLAAGMNDYLSKPVQKEQLQATLEHWKQLLSEGQERL